MVKEIILYIKGMDCEDEVRLIRGTFDGLKGIESCEINLMNQSLKATYDPSIISVQDIQNAVARTGMKASLKKGVVVKGQGVW